MLVIQQVSCTKGMKMNATERSQIVFAIPEGTHLERIRQFLMKYKGGVAATLKDKPSVTIIAKVEMVAYTDDDDCIEMTFDALGKKVTALFYPKDIRNYYLFGVAELAHAMSKNEEGEDCLASVRLLN